MKVEKDIEREQLEWQIQQIRLRQQYAGTPAGFCDEEEEKAAVSQWEADWEAWEEQQNHFLGCEYQPEPEIFVGRKKELEQISEALERKGREPVILYGMAGSGKSALVREWIRIHHREYRHIVMLQFEESFFHTVCSDVLLPMSGMKYQKSRCGSEMEYFRMKRKLLEEYVRKEKTLVVIDGYNQLRDRNMKRVFSMECDRIVTTRLDPALWGYDGIQIDTLQMEEEWQEFASALGAMENRKMTRFFEEQKNRYQGHMLRMLLCVREKQGESVNEELHAFEASMIMELPLNQRERAVLSFLAVMPERTISLEKFRLISGCTDRLLQRLMSFLLIARVRKDTGEEVLQMHPVTADAVKRLMPPTSPACAKMIRGLAELIRSIAWQPMDEENHELEYCVLAVMKAFPCPAAYLAEPFGDMCRYLWRQGFAEEAYGYLFRIFDSVKNYFGDIYQMTGQAAFQVAELFYLEKKWKEAQCWYERGMEILKNSRPVNRAYYQSLSLGSCRIAAILRITERMGESENYRKEAEAYLKRYRVSPADTDYYFFLRQFIAIEKTWNLIRQGRQEEAEKLCQENMEAVRLRYSEQAGTELWYEIMCCIR